MRKLLTRVQFEAALKAEVIARSENFVLHRLKRDGEPALAFPPSSSQEGSEAAFGVLVPKRWAKRAVTRNLIRRQAWALARTELEAQPRALYLLRLRKSWPAGLFVSARSPALCQDVRTQVRSLFSDSQR